MIATLKFHALAIALLWLTTIVGIARGQSTEAPLSSPNKSNAIEKSAGTVRDQIQVLHQQAIAAWKAKDWAKVVDLYSQAIALDPNYAQGWRWRGAARSELGQHDLAIADIRKAVELEPKSANAHNGLCWSLILAGRALEARPYCQQAISIDSAHVGATVNLGHTYLLLGDRASAEPWYQKTIPLIDSERELTEGPVGDFNLFRKRGWQVALVNDAAAWFEPKARAWLARKGPLDALLTQANEAESRKDYALATRLRQERLAQLVALIGNGHPRVQAAQRSLINTQDRYADQLYQRGEYTSTLPLYEASLTHFESTHGRESTRVATALNDVARTRRALGQYDKALPLYTRALAISEKAEGAEHPETGTRLNNLAGLYESMGQYDKALPLYIRALAIAEKTQGAEHPNTGTTLSNVAGLYRYMGQSDKALPLYTRALAVAEKTQGVEHPATGIRLNNLAGLYESMGQYDKALPLYTRALAIAEKTQGAEHPSTGTRLNNLAELYREMGQYDKALPLYTRALAIAEKAEGPEHPSTGTRLNNLAGLYRAMGQYDKALPLYIRALAIAEKSQGPGHPSTGTILNNLARLYKAMAQYARAEPLYERALAIAEKAEGPEHPSTGTSLNDLAGLYTSMGQYASAEPLYDRALAIFEKTRGPAHPSTSTSLSNLAGLYQSMGQYDKALPLYTRALAIAEKAEGPEHPSTGTRLNNLAQLYVSMGQYARAEPLFERALAIAEKAEGPEHPNTGTRLNNLASLYKAMGQYARAEPLYERSLANFEKSQGAEHPSTGTGVGNLAGLYRSMGQYDKALPLYTRALAIAEKAEGSEHPSTGARLNNLALLYVSMGQYDKALPLYVRALAVFEKAQGPAHPSTGTSLGNLAGLYQAMGQYDKALPLSTRALAIAEKAQGPEHPETGTRLNNLAGLYQVMGQYAGAEPLYVRALAIAEKSEGPEHPSAGTILNNLARLYYAMGQYPRAEPLFERAFAIAEKAEGPEHPSTGTSLGNLAELYQAMGQYARAEPLNVRALAIAEKAQGPEHPRTGAILNKLARLYYAMGHYALAESLYVRALAIANSNAHSPHERFATQRDFAHAAYGKYQRERVASQSVADEKASDLARTALDGQRDQAIFFGKFAVNTFQAIRDSNQSLDRENQQSLISSNQGIYERLADWLIAAGRMAEAEEVLGLLKQQELRAFTRQGGDQVKLLTLTGPERNLAARYAALASDSARTFVRQETLKQKQKHGYLLSDEESRELGVLAERSREQRGAFELFLSGLQAALSSDPLAAARERDQLQRQMKSLASALRRIDAAQPGGHVGLHYVVTDERLSILVTLADRSFARQVPVTAEALRAQVAQLRQALGNAAFDPKPAAKALYQSLIAPVAADLAEIKPHTLVLSLTDQLRYAPFAALLDAQSGKYLIEHYALAIYTSAGGGEARALDARTWSVSALGVTRGHRVMVAGEARPFNALPAVRDELHAIVQNAAAGGVEAGVLPGEIALDPEFTRSRFERALQRHPVLHVSTHFTFTPGSDDLSFLLLGDGSVLSLAEMKDMPFEKVELLTLSACETAKGGGRNERGAEVEGLAAAVQQQGAKSVLATLWPVFDPSTARLMQHFYAHRTASDKATSAQALREAQLALLRGAYGAATATEAANLERKTLRPEGAFTPDPKAPYAHPYYWAPFVLMGNWL